MMLSCAITPPPFAEGRSDAIAAAYVPPPSACIPAAALFHPQTVVASPFRSRSYSELIRGAVQAMLKPSHVALSSAAPTAVYPQQQQGPLVSVKLPALAIPATRQQYQFHFVSSVVSFSGGSTSVTHCANIGIGSP